ncbi:MAG: hypothetical protein ACLP3C_23955 [Mycobacterium sp.]|uniref:hypothetical protein n=1 Tax=Mycobacterium sp. TaxID=1785 RepID=UPI003F9A8DCA
MTVTRATLLEATAVCVGAPMLALGVGVGAMTIIAPPAHADPTPDANDYCILPPDKPLCKICYHPDGSVDYWIGNC